MLYAVGERDEHFRYSHAQRDHEGVFKKRQTKEKKSKRTHEKT